MIYPKGPYGEMVITTPNDTGGRSVVAVLVPWDDDRETPLVAVGRLNAKVLDLEAAYFRNVPKA